MLKIVKGKIDRAQKVVIYGSEGIGKSTMASQFPDPLFIDTEGGTSHMDVNRIDRPASWPELLSIVQEVAKEDVCKTLVIDTADWAEQLCTDYICQKYKQTSIESFGYGKGYTYLSEEFARLLSACDDVVASGKHVVITAHAKMRKFEQPDEQNVCRAVREQHSEGPRREACDLYKPPSMLGREEPARPAGGDRSVV